MLGWEQFSQLALRSAGRLRVRSALNPCLLMLSLCIPAGLYLASESKSALLQIAGIGLIFVAVIIFAVGFFYFMVKNPDKLRSEDYEIRMHALTMIERKGDPIPIALTSVEAIANPSYQEPAKKALEYEREDGA
jgi:hypothetical protein